MFQLQYMHFNLPHICEVKEYNLSINHFFSKLCILKILSTFFSVENFEKKWRAAFLFDHPFVISPMHFMVFRLVNVTSKFYSAKSSVSLADNHGALAQIHWYVPF